MTSSLCGSCAGRSNFFFLGTERDAASSQPGGCHFSCPLRPPSLDLARGMAAATGAAALGNTPSGRCGECVLLSVTSVLAVGRGASRLAGASLPGPGSPWPPDL